MASFRQETVLRFRRSYYSSFTKTVLRKTLLVISSHNQGKYLMLDCTRN